MAELILNLTEGSRISFHIKEDSIEVLHIMWDGKTQKEATLGFLDKTDSIHLRDFLACNIANPPPASSEFFKGFSRALLPVVVEFAEMMRRALVEEQGGPVTGTTGPEGGQGGK